ncbi:MAG TPA: glycosyltransferase family 2 protein [Mycobacteriales bacterium]|jgi:GT2 family glycosyltransferase|nr:glycosyltransferase family 2 protein [Mycobacteriales bacterium]
MSATSSRSRYPGHHVTAVVLCHNNAKLLAKTLDALEAQDQRPDRVVAVDLGSTDRSVAVATDRLGANRVAELAAGTSTNAAVQAGLELGATRAGQRAREDGPLEWIWLLHDDSAPDPEALDELLLRVSHSPSVWLAGPKIRDWDDRLLIRAGLTIDSAGNIDSGLDRREPDQGQRDDIDEVLAVDTAGSFVRRDVWEYLDGEDPAWSEYAADVDLGWRVNAAGGRVVVVPRAVLRHAGGDCPGDHPAGSPLRAQTIRRRNGMQVVLANTAGWMVPLLLLRYLVGGVVHGLALVVLSRRPREAAAELLGVVQVLAAPGAIVSGRRRRATTAEVSYGDLRRLFPPAGRWVTGLVGVRAQQATDAPDAPVTRKRRVAVESGPVSEEAESLGDELSAFGEFLRRPASLLFVVLSLLSLIANRHILSGTLHGGRLLPAPSGAGDLWSSYLSAWHPSTVGSLAPSPPSTALLALLATVLLGKAWLAIDVILLGAVPLAALSAFTSLRVLTTAVRIRVWASVVYALLPAVTGAVASGRLDVVVAAIVLPRIIRSIGVAWQADALGTPRGRCVRAGLWLTVGAAFAPLLWVFAAVVCGVVVGITYFRGDDGATDGESATVRLVRAAGILLVPLVVLLPWTAHVLVHPSLLFSGSGLPEFYSSHSAPSGIWLAFLHPGGRGQPPAWVGIPLVGAVALGMQRDSRVTTARVGAGVFVVGVLIAVLMTRGAGITAGYPSTRYWPGLALLIAGAGALTTAVVAAVGARPALQDRSFGWRQPAAVVVVGLAVISTVTFVGTWLVRGGGQPLRGDSAAVLPPYVQAELNVPGATRALVLSNDHGLIRYALVRTAAGPVLGSGDLPTSGSTAKNATTNLSDAVRDLVAARPGAGMELVPFGVGYVVASPATARRIAPQLGQLPSLTVIPVPSATVWHSTLATGELTVLAGASATSALSGSVSTTVPSVVLPVGTDPRNLHATVAPGAPDRLLVLAEPATGGWHATVDGHPLHATKAYGWAQAFELPSSGGQVHVSYGSGARSWWALFELLAAIAVALVGTGAAPHVPHRDAT